VEKLDERSGETIDEEKAALINESSGRDALNESKFRSVPLPLISTCAFACSVVLYALMRYRAPSEAACERKMWAFSKNHLKEWTSDAEM
jgi:hypothetical protein